MTKRPRKRRSRPDRETLPCVLCGSVEQIENHHVAGRHHAPEFTLPVCRDKHATLHRTLEQAGVDLRHTANTRSRLKQALRAVLCFLWLLSDHMDE
jgi:hypothetical protein